MRMKKGRTPISLLVAGFLLALAACGPGTTLDAMPDPIERPNPESAPSSPFEPGNAAPTSTGNPPTKPGTVTLAGLAQKGPFLEGTRILVQDLDASLNPSNRFKVSTRTDALGEFTLTNISVSTPTEIIAHGHYFNEITGTISREPITLRSARPAHWQGDANVNALTTLAIPRTQSLILQGIEAGAAKTQAQREILRVFGITFETGRFESMDLSAEGASNAVLLAVSAVLQQNNDETGLMDMIMLLGDDIADNGIVDDSALLDRICQNSMDLNLPRIRNNLQDWYAALGQPARIPAFENYVDTDCNGIPDGTDRMNAFIRESGPLDAFQRSRDRAPAGAVELGPDL